MRPIRLLLPACALLAVAPALPAQSSPGAPALVPHVGTPVAYRIGLPRGWAVGHDDGMLKAEFKNAAAVVGAHDLVEDTEPSEIPVSKAEERRIMTNMFLGSDSLLLATVTLFLRGMGTDEASLRDLVREIRTLGGQRSAYLSGRGDDLIGAPAWIEVHLTFRDGVMYVLAFIAPEAEYAEYKPLFARVRDSFVLAEPPTRSAAR